MCRLILCDITPKRPLHTLVCSWRQEATLWTLVGVLGSWILNKSVCTSTVDFICCFLLITCVVGVWILSLFSIILLNISLRGVVLLPFGIPKQLKSCYNDLHILSYIFHKCLITPSIRYCQHLGNAINLIVAKTNSRILEYEAAIEPTMIEPSGPCLEDLSWLWSGEGLHVR